MTKRKRIRWAAVVVLTVLGVAAVVTGFGVAWVTVPAEPINVEQPAGEVGSGLHLPLGGEQR